MRTPDEPLHVAVYFAGTEDGTFAEQALKEVRPDEVEVHEGAVEGWVDQRNLTKLVDRGLIVDPLSAGFEEPPNLPSPAHHPDPKSTSLEAFREQAQFVSFTEAGLEVSDQKVEVPDPRLHESGDHLLRPAPEDAPEQAVYHIRLAAPITGEQRHAFEELGIDLAAFEPPDAYRTFLTREQYGPVKEMSFVKDVVRYQFAETVTPRLLGEVKPLVEEAEAGEQLLSAGAPTAPEPGVFDCILHRVADREHVQSLLKATTGVEVLESSQLYIRFRAPTDPRLLAAIGKLPEVRLLGPYIAPQLTADYARKLVGLEAANPQPPGQWTGEGEVVALFDSGVDDTHPDLAKQVKSKTHVQGASAEDAVGHGTHVAGIVAGTGVASKGRTRGMAPAAKLAMIGIVSDDRTLLTPANWAELLERALETGAKIINLSAGRGAHGAYDFGSLSMDEFVYAHPDMLVVVSAGNDGSAPEGYVGFRTIFSPASAKNVITVGASTTDRPNLAKTWQGFDATSFPVSPCGDELMAGDPDLPAALSSRGPTDFDSIKPDLLAPGTYILAPRAKGLPDASFWEPFDEHYAYLGGTSMAAPVVAGAAAVLRQYLRTTLSAPAPSAALVKALLIAATRPIPARKLPEKIQESVGFPDFDQGFGRLDLATILPHAQAPPGRRVVFDDVANNSPDALNSRPQATPDKPARNQRNYHAKIGSAAAEPLRIALTWTDWPSAGVQNNLHLRISTPGGESFDGNPELRFGRPLDVLQPYVDPARQGATRIPAFDKLNNVELVRIEAPAQGTYTIEVIPENTPKPPQGYALALVGEVSGELEAVE